MMEDQTRIELTITPDQRGSYFTIPFKVPEGIESLEITYQYERRPRVTQKLATGVFNSTPEINIVDLGLIAPDGRQVGASGADKTHVFISECEATPGYRSCAIRPGDWQIIVGAYKVAADGVLVRYEITLNKKTLRLLKGDLHVHSIASDGVHSLEELALKAKANGLDFVAITDHNQIVSSNEMPRIPGVTLIPGMEWTHYQGHANFLGVDMPYDEPFFTNSFEESRARFESARKSGALITINHPFEGDSRFQFDLHALPFDCLEVWNGPMRESNLKAVGLWQQLLSSGLRLPISGGSDYHRDTPFIFLGGPTMGVYAMSAGKSDILDALRQGHSFITFAPNGPTIEVHAGSGMMGDQVEWKRTREFNFNVAGLLAGDVVRVVTGVSSEVVHTAPGEGDLLMTYNVSQPGFARVEVLRGFLPGLPLLPALLGNPIYFTA